MSLRGYTVLSPLSHYSPQRLKNHTREARLTGWDHQLQQLHAVFQKAGIRKSLWTADSQNRYPGKAPNRPQMCFLLCVSMDTPGFLSHSVN